MNLPDITGKVKISSSGIAATEAEVKGFSESVKRSLDSNSGAGSALVRFGKDGELASLRISSATAKTRADMDLLASRVRAAAADIGKDFEEGTAAVIRLSEDGSVALGKLSQAAVSTATDVETASASFLGMGPAGLIAAGAIAIVAAAAAAATAPILGLAAGVSAVAGLGGGILGIFGGLGAAAVLLAQRVQGVSQASQNAAAAQQQLTQATNQHQVAVKQLETLQNSLKGHKATADQLQLLADLQQEVKKSSYDLLTAQNAVKAAGEATVTPFQKLTDHVGKLADALSKQATPAANLIYTWLGKLADRIEPVASKLLDWFSTRLPKVLPIVDKLVGDIGHSLEGFGARLGPIIDNWIKHPEQFEKSFKEVADKVISVTGDIIVKAQQLADWWSKHHGEIEHDVGDVFSVIAAGANIAITITRALIVVFDMFNDTLHKMVAAAQATGAAIGATFSAIGREARIAEDAVGRLALALSRLPGLGGLTAIGADLLGNADIGNTGSGKRALGGPVVPGRIYTVGEQGPETLVMGSRGGYVIPNAGGSGAGRAPVVNLTINGAGMNPEQVAMAVDRHLSRLLLAT